MSLADRALAVHTVYVAYSCVPLCPPSSKQSPPCDAAELLSKENRGTKRARGCRPSFDSRRGPWLHIAPPSFSIISAGAPVDKETNCVIKKQKIGNSDKEWIRNIADPV